MSQHHFAHLLHGICYSVRGKYKEEFYLLRVILDTFNIKDFVHGGDFISVLCDCIKVSSISKGHIHFRILLTALLQVEYT